MPRKKINIISEFPNSVESKILKQICKKHGAYNIYIKPFSRYGFSGAKLFLVFFFDHPKGIPYLVKIGTLDSMLEEYDAVKTMYDLAPDCKLAEDMLFKTDDMGALLYIHRGAITQIGADQPVTFKEVLFKSSSSFNSSHAESIIEEVFEKLEEAHKSSESKSINVNTEYDRYFRGHIAKKCLQKILGSEIDKEYFTFLGSPIYNPIKFIDNLPGLINVVVGRIHGDLHPDNIVIDKRYNASLIDFAWAKEPRDVLIDYVLLENSIRFMHFTKAINVKEQKLVDELLLNENGYEEILRLPFFDNELNSCYHRLASLIGKIRLCAKNLLGTKFSFEKYLFTQFIVLYGLLRYENYNQLIATRELGLIAKKLKEIDTDILLR